MAESEQTSSPSQADQQPRMSAVRRAMKRGVWVVAWLTIMGMAVGGYVMGFSAATREAEAKPTETETKFVDVTQTINLDPSMTAKPTLMSVSGEVVPHLWLGTATVATGHSSSLYGVRTVWPQTVDGAVGAAMNYLTARYRLQWYLDSSGIELEERLYSTAWNTRYPPRSADRAETRAFARRALSIDANGNVVDFDGEINPYFHFYGGGEPRYGAYRVIEVKKNAADAPVSVRVAVVMPGWTGVGPKPDEGRVYLSFEKSECVMTFGEGDAGPKDWRLDECEFDDFKGLGRNSNPGYQSLRDALGPGWAVPADSTEKALAGVPFTS